MKNDQALRKSLNRLSDELPYGFEQRVMRRIQQEEAQRDRKLYYRSLSLVTLVSIALIVGLYHIVHLLFKFDFIKSFQQFRLNTPHLPFKDLSPNGQSLLLFCVFLALLIVILLGLDLLLRSRFRKSKM